MRRLLIAVATVALAAVIATNSDARKRSPTGSIKGSVVFEGTPPARAKVNRSSDPICKRNKTPDESVIVGDQGGLQDVFVQVEAERAFAIRAPEDPVVIDQVGCAYSPRVVGVISGQPLHINNGDKTLHNVHAYLDGDTAWNMAQPKQAKPIKKALDANGVLELKCDVHPWMRAWAGYVDHDQFDVTGATGSFEIDNVTVGKHTVSAWHPTLGKQTVEVTVKSRKTATATLRFK